MASPIKSIYRKLVTTPTRHKIKRFLGYKVYNPVRKGKLQKYIYIHIPKTGGTSISNIIGDLEHRTAREIIDIVGKSTWKKCYKFAVVRNPFDLVYSHYKFKKKHNHQGLAENPLSFEEWVEKIYGDHPDPQYLHNPKMYMCQMDWLTDDQGALNIDFIGKFEQISSDFKIIASQIGIKEELGHLNRSDSTSYKDAYSERSRKLVQRAFQKDIDYWKFEF